MGTGGALVVIDFTEQGNSAWFRQEGWSGQEPDRVWAVGPHSVLSVPFQPSDRPMVLEAEIAPLRAPPAIAAQLVRFNINGAALGSIRLETRSLIRCEIDPALVRADGAQEIGFEFPGFFHAAALPEGGDERPLSGWFSFIRIYTTDMFKPGPWFPASRPDIPVVELSPPLADARGGDVRAARYHTFGSKGSMPSPGADWDSGEDTVAWSIASICHLTLPGPLARCSYVLRIDTSPLVVPGMIRQQNVTVLLDGIVIGQLSLRDAASCLLPLPRELTDGQDRLALSFILPDAIRRGEFGRSRDSRLLGIAISGICVIPMPDELPCVDQIRAEQAGPMVPVAVADRFVTEDSTTLPAAIETALGIDTATLLRGFESLGTDRAFGAVQRERDVDVLNLFRFCDVALPDLVAALSDDLMLLTDPDCITVEPPAAPGQGYVLTVPGYNLRWPIQPHEAGTEATTHDHVITLGYMRRKFIEGLRAGRKIYVVHRRRPISISEAAAVLTALHRFGSATLLCVEPAPAGHRPGAAELLAPDLIRGYVERSAPDTDVEATDPTIWLRVLANAALLHRDP